MTREKESRGDENKRNKNKKEEENVKRLTLTDCPPFKPIHSLSGIYFGASDCGNFEGEKIKITD